jgi:hypothetical protein
MAGSYSGLAIGVWEVWFSVLEKWGIGQIRSLEFDARLFLQCSLGGKS